MKNKKLGPTTIPPLKEKTQIEKLREVMMRQQVAAPSITPNDPLGLLPDAMDEWHKTLGIDLAKPGKETTATSIRLAQENNVLNRKAHFQLSNHKIRELFSAEEFWVSADDAVAAFNYWVFKQNPDLFRDDDLVMSMKVHAAVKAFKNHVTTNFKEHMPISYSELSHWISDIEFERIPEVLALNQTRPEFIDLTALARNVFYMIIRESITQG